MYFSILSSGMFNFYELKKQEMIKEGRENDEHLCLCVCQPAPSTASLGMVLSPLQAERVSSESPLIQYIKADLTEPLLEEGDLPPSTEGKS